MRGTRILFAGYGAILATSLLLAGQQAAGPQAPAAQAGPSVQFQVPPMPELPNSGLGETDQAVIPGQPWRIRDLNRPKPVTVAAGRHPGDAPSDAIILFGGKDLIHQVGERA